MGRACLPCFVTGVLLDWKPSRSGKIAANSSDDHHFVTIIIIFVPLWDHHYHPSIPMFGGSRRSLSGQNRLMCSQSTLPPKLAWFEMYNIFKVTSLLLSANYLETRKSFLLLAQVKSTCALEEKKLCQRNMKTFCFDTAVNESYSFMTTELYKKRGKKGIL